MKPRLNTAGCLSLILCTKKRIVIDVFVSQSIVRKTAAEHSYFIRRMGGYQMSDTLFCLVLKGQMSICMRREMIVGKWSMTIFPSPKQITMTLE